MSKARVFGDWGTTRLRLYRAEGGAVTDRESGPGALSGEAGAVLGERLAPWIAEGGVEAVTLCGMAGAKGGLVDAGYVACPASREGWLSAPTRTQVAGVEVSVLPGVCTGGDGVGEVPDVMRGEETQVFGAMALIPELASGRHLVVLPGTHCKWVELVNGTITGFRTYPTGELFALLTGHSTLGGPEVAGEGTFDEGYARGLERCGEPLGASLFEARAARIVQGRSSEWSRGYLSGLLVGGEVAAQDDRHGLVYLIGDATISALYRRALEASGIAVTMIDGDEAVLAGLRQASGVTA